MSLSSKLQGLAAATGVFFSAFMPQAQATEELTVYADQSQIIRLERAPGTVVVGNPSIADVTIQGNQIFLHGRAFGKTNIIVLDENGNALADYNINVDAQDDYSAVVFKGSPAGILQSTFTCKTNCEVALHVGDDAGTFKTVNEQQKNKIGIAQGQKSSDTAAGGTGQNAPAQ